MSTRLPLALLLALVPVVHADGVFVRFKLEEPMQSRYHVALGGYIHKTPWYLPKAIHPKTDIAAGEFTPWFDVKAWADNRLHGRLNRAGGVAEFPNVTADFVTTPKADKVRVVVELATEADEKKIVKRWRESFAGSLTSFLVSPDLARDADQLENASEMTARRLKWAKDALKGQKPVAPSKLIVQTSFWSPQRPELNLQEAEVLRLLGFNVVGNQPAEVRARNWFRVPGATHDVHFDPGVTRQQADDNARKLAGAFKGSLSPGVPFNFADEITAGTTGKSKEALAHFHAWLKEKGIRPADLGVDKIEEVEPIETPDVLRDRIRFDPKGVSRIFYYTSRFRQEATTERLRWLTESFHKHAGDRVLTSTLPADHPYFSGTGLGMGMGPNPAWGRPALAADWFDLGRRRAVDLVGIEDWLGLQYMYGPNYTWEGFQLMGFQAAIFRSASQGKLPIIAWITPSDETNLRLKTASALCQGAKHFYFWTYGPTCTSTENYWSDLRGSYDGIAAVTRQLVAAEHILAEGTMRPAKIAILYSISSDLWQPFGYVHMLERRGTYLALTHEQRRVDFLSEEDVEAGRLKNYEVLYVTDPCIREAAMGKIADWVKAGGHIQGSCAAGTRNEFNEEVKGLSEVFGIEPKVKTKVIPGRYHIRGALNQVEYKDWMAAERVLAETGVIGVRVDTQAAQKKVAGVFRDNAPAVVINDYGKGKAVWIGACPAITYIKDAEFVPSELKELWPGRVRRFITYSAPRRIDDALVDLDFTNGVEASVYDSEKGSLVVLANFTYKVIPDQTVRVYMQREVKKVTIAGGKELQFTCKKDTDQKGPRDLPFIVRFELKLGLSEMVLLE